MAEVLAKTTFSSVIHNNEVCDEIVKWGKANGYPVTKAKLQNKLGAYVGFSPEYMILAKRRPPIPGGWNVTVEKYAPEERIIPLNVKEETGEINHFITKMMGEYVKEGLKMDLSDNIYEAYGTRLRDLKVVGHPILLNNFEDFIENMR